MEGKRFIVYKHQLKCEIPEHKVKLYVNNGWTLDKPVEKTIEQHTVAELKTLCNDKGLEYSHNIRKSDLIKLLQGNVDTEDEPEATEESNNQKLVDYEDGLIL